jgi:hypothetical protein
MGNPRFGDRIKVIQKLYADFNDIRGEGLIHCLPGFTDPPRKGDEIIVGDADGNKCRGTVHGILVTVKLDMDTWQSSDQEQGKSE